MNNDESENIYPEISSTNDVARDLAQFINQKEPEINESTLIEKSGVEPTTWIDEQIQEGKKIIGIGERHAETSIETSFKNILEHLVETDKLGIVNLEIHNDHDVDEMNQQLERYLLTKSEEDFPKNSLDIHSESFREIVEFLIEKKIKINFVGSQNLENRDEEIHSQTITKHQSLTPDKVSILYTGNLHLLSPIDINNPENDLTKRADFISIRHEKTPEITRTRLIAHNTNTQALAALDNHKCNEDAYDESLRRDYSATIFIPT